MTRRLPALRYLGKRLALAVITFLGVTFLVFLLSVLAPGDPLEAGLFESRAGLSSADDEELIEEQRREKGLDRPLVVRYFSWLGDLGRLRLGRSLADGKPVATKLAERIPNTLLLNGTALVLVFLVSLPLGVVLALHLGTRADRIVCGALDLLYAAPYFWTAVLLQYILAVRLGWLPVRGPGGLDLESQGGLALWLDRARHLVLPACLLAYGSLAYFVRFVRSSVFDAMQRKFVQTARSLGLPQRRLVRKFALRYAMVALIPLAGALLGRLLAGSVVLEAIFSWPGIGQLFAESIHARDYPTVQGLAALSAIMVLGAGLLADLALVLADPRVSFERGES